MVRLVAQLDKFTMDGLLYVIAELIAQPHGCDEASCCCFELTEKSFKLRQAVRAHRARREDAGQRVSPRCAALSRDESQSQ